MDESHLDPSVLTDTYAERRGRDNPLEALVLDHLIHLYSDLKDPFYLKMVVVASPQKLDFDDFTQMIQRESGEERVSNVMPQEQLQQVLAEQHPWVFTDDYVPVDNLLVPIFEERFGYRR
jgi:hypothetical protein